MQQQQQQLGARLVGWIKRAYPYFHALYEGSSFVYMLLYLHDSAQYFHWSYHLQQLLVRRMPLQYMVRYVALACGGLWPSI